MTEELRPLDISHSDEVRRLVEEVHATDEALALQIHHRTVAILAPAPRSRSTARQRKVTSAADPLWNIVGLGRTDGPGDVAENVDAYLTKALLPREG